MKKILLTLGTITTVVAPVVLVVSCGGVDQLPVQKKRVKGLLGGYNFPKNIREGYIKRIEVARSVEAVSNIGEEILAKGEELTKKNESLDNPRGLALRDLITYDKLTPKEISDYKNKINNAPSESKIKEIKNQAKNENAKRVLKEHLAEWEAPEELEFKTGCYLDRDLKAGFKKMREATTKQELSLAYNDLQTKINKPLIARASESDFEIVQHNGGPTLFFDKNATELTWTDMNKNDQPYITYKKVGVDNSGVPLLEVYKNNVKQENSDSVTIQKVDKNDCGIVLKDFSGSYHVNGVKNLDDFASDTIILNFLKRSEPVIDSNNAELKDIVGMDKILESLGGKGIEFKDGKLTIW